jgi:hypothetical protein
MYVDVQEMYAWSMQINCKKKIGGSEGQWNLSLVLYARYLLKMPLENCYVLDDFTGIPLFCVRYSQNITVLIIDGH